MDYKEAFMLKSFPVRISAPFSALIVGTLYLLSLTLVKYDDPYRFMTADYYNRQVDAWLEGRLDLPAGDFDYAVVRKLGSPACSDYVRDKKVFDLSAYKGKIYSYFGAVPALVVNLPVRLLTGVRLPSRAAVFFFAFGAFLWGAALARHLQRRWFPRLSGSVLELFTLTLGLANLGTFFIRRSRVYEIAISSGMFFQAGALYFLVTAFRESSVSTKRLLCASVFLGLSAGSRANMLPACAVLLLLTGARLGRAGAASARNLLSLFGPFTAAVLLLFVYNALRFGNPFVFGVEYQMSPASHYALGVPQGQEAPYMPSVLYSYLFQPPVLLAEPPYVRLETPQWPAHLHPLATFAWDKSGVGGVFSAVPLTMLLFFAPVLYALGRADRARELFTRRGALARGFFLTALYYFGVPFLMQALRFIGNEASAPLYFLNRWYESLPLWFVFLACFYASVLGRLAAEGPRDREFPWDEASLLLACFVLNFLVLTSAVTGAVRYLGDFVQPLLILAGLLWFYYEKKMESDPLNFWALRSVAVSLAVLSVVFGAAFTLTPL